MKSPQKLAVPLTFSSRSADSRNVGSCCHTRLRRPLYEAHPASCFALDEQGSIIACSQYACEQLGYSVEELLARPFLDLSFPEDRPKVSSLIASCLRVPGELAQHQGRKLRRDERLLWVNERARAVPGDDGEPLLLVIWEDISDRRLADAAVVESEAKYRAIVEASMD